MDKEKWDKLKRLKPPKPKQVWESQKRGTYIKAKHSVIRDELEKEQDKQLKEKQNIKG